MKRFQICSVLVLATAAPGRAGIMIDRQPNQGGGLASDTAFEGSIPWQRVADDILLNEPAEILRLNWWGFYNADNPPAMETMRIRFYGDNSGLPDDNNILFEESFLNPSRIATGKTIFVGIDPDEYFFQVDFTTPFNLDAGSLHWLEIVQIGDVDTRFRWEFSGPAQIGLAAINAALPVWHKSVDAHNAFQLSTVPEPSVFGLVMFGLILLGKRRSRGEG